MQTDPASLENLRDIAVPPPVPWWPPAPGWWLVLAVIAVALSVLMLRGWRAWQSNAYRRAALRELQSAKTISEIAEVLKRTALVAFPRIETAALSGSVWCEWLGNTMGERVPKSVSSALVRGVFAENESANVGEVSAFAANWIKLHNTAARGTS